MKRIICVVVGLALAVSSATAALTVTSPNGGENWPKGGTKLITWTAAGVSGNVKLVLFKGGVKYGDIASSVPASQQSFSWVVGACDIGTAPEATDYKVKVRTLDNTMSDSSNGNFTIGPSGPGPGPGPDFALTAPNGGESWPRGSARDITWNPGVTSGYIRLDLYKGGTNSANYLGCIKTMTAAAAGKYSWHVGDREGMTPAAEGSDYYVVIHAYTPDLKDPGNGPFAIAPADHQATPSAKAARAKVSTASFSLTNPRRGDRWYKGTGYTITWTTGGLNESPVRLDLLNIDGSTLVLPIAENIPNNGQHFWAVPMSLPDAETLYRVRIRTMDNAHSDMPAAFYIVKAKPVSGPPSIKVTAPGGPSQLGTGLTYAISWTSTCGTSVNGPTDDFFTIELMNGAGSTRVRWLLENARATYDGGNPDGSHSWHWDWKIAVNETAGTYRIRVTNLTGKCVGLGEAFPVVYRQEHYDYEVVPRVQNCFYLLSWCCANKLHPRDLTLRRLEGVPGLARVGFYFYQSDDELYGFSLQQHLVLRSLLRVGDEHWYKDMGHLVEAKMTIERQWRTDLSHVMNPCLGGVVLLSQSVPCENGDPNAPTRTAPPQIGGQKVPIDTGQGDVWLVDLTQPYLILMNQGYPDLGLMLYAATESLPFEPTPGEYYMHGNAECYKVTLRFRFAKDILQ
jgi:hypothetical protein